MVGESQRTRIVAIGASAGGLEAIRTVLSQLVVPTGIAFIVIQHLDPHHGSLLADILGHQTDLEVVEASDGIRLDADHVYVIPSGLDLIVDRDHLRTVPRPQSPAEHHPFDLLLNSLAKRDAERTVGVVMSGTDRDGLEGLAALRAAGGTVIAQDPADALYDSMPRHIVEANIADHVLPADQIAKQLTGTSREQPAHREHPVSVMRPETPGKWTSQLVELAESLVPEGDDRPGALVNRTMQVLHMRGEISRYLRFPSGPSTLSLAKMVPADVSLDIQGLLKAADETDGSSSKSVRWPAVGETRIEVLPVKVAEHDRNYLVLFEASMSEPSQETDVSDELLGLRRRYSELRATLQSALEERDALNEELQSSIEESQSVTEELQTAKEELQSTNEELITVNDELQDRNNDLGALNADLVNLLASIDIPVVMLSKQLEVRRFIPAAQRIFNLIPSDVGRPITDLRLKVHVDDLQGLLLEVIETGNTHVMEVGDSLGRWYQMRLRAYRDADERIDGAVVTLFDITDAKRAYGLMEDSYELVAALFETVGDPLVVLDENHTITMANAAFYDTFRADELSAPGRRFEETGAGQWDVPHLSELLDSTLKQGVSFERFAVTYRFPDGPRELLLSGRRLVQPHSGGELLLLAIVG